MLAIVIATYQRPDGKTPYYLTRTLDSIKSQTYQDYLVYLIGDAYANNAEFISIASRYPKVKYINLERSVERDRYPEPGLPLWCAGGVTAANTGIEWALRDGLKYVCHQAHDDYWDTNHLEVIAKVIRQKHPFFVCTISTYGTGYLPNHEVSNAVIPFYPLDGGMIASAACVKYSDTHIRVVDRLHSEGIMSPCDAYLWEQLRNEMKAKGRHGYLICTLTCHHDEEGYSKR